MHSDTIHNILKIELVLCPLPCLFHHLFSLGDSAGGLRHHSLDTLKIRLMSLLEELYSILYHNTLKTGLMFLAKA